MGFPNGTLVKNLPVNAGDTGSVPVLGRSPGEASGSPLQYSCLEIPMDRGSWWLGFVGLQRVGRDWAWAWMSECAQYQLWCWWLALEKSLNYIEIQPKMGMPQSKFQQVEFVYWARASLLETYGNWGIYHHDEPFTSIQRRDQNQQKGENKPGSRENSFLYNFFWVLSLNLYPWRWELWI